MTLGTVHGQIQPRLGDKPYVEKFLHSSFTLPISSTGGTATTAVAIPFSGIDTSWREVEIFMSGLTAATTIAAPAGGLHVLTLSTTSGQSSYAGDYTYLCLTIAGTATLARTPGTQGKDVVWSLDFGATGFNVWSATDGSPRGADLHTVIHNPFSDTLKKHMVADFQWQASASENVGSRTTGMCSATVAFNGLRFTPNGVTQNWLAGNVEVWVTRLNYSGVRP